MAIEAWTVDSQPLSAFAYDIATYDGLDDVPNLEGSNWAAEQEHGAIWLPKYYGEASKSLSMIVSNADSATGVVPSALDQQRAKVDANLDALLRIFYRPRKLLDVRRTLSGGAVRQAFCEVVTGIKPNTLGLNSMRFGVDLRVPSGFWQDATDVTSAQYNTGSNTNIVEFNAATAPMTNLKYVLTGPITNPRVTDVESGSYFQYNGTIAAAQTFTIDCLNMSSLIGSGGFTPVAVNLVHDGSTRWLELNSTLSGTLINYTGTSTTGATKVQIIGRRRYLR